MRPRWLKVDLYRAQISDELMNWCALRGIEVVDFAGKTKEQPGKVEHRAQLFELMLEDVLADVQPQTECEWRGCLNALQEAKKSLLLVSSVSPMQLVFGRNPEILGNLLSDKPDLVAKSSMQHDRDAGQAASVRTFARAGKTRRGETTKQRGTVLFASFFLFYSCVLRVFFVCSSCVLLLFVLCSSCVLRVFFVCSSCYSSVVRVFILLSRNTGMFSQTKIQKWTKQFALNAVTVGARVSHVANHDQSSSSYGNRVRVTATTGACFAHEGSFPASSLHNLPQQRSPHCTHENLELNCSCLDSSSAVFRHFRGTRQPSDSSCPCECSSHPFYVLSPGPPAYENFCPPEMPPS